MNPILLIHGFGADKKQYQPIIKFLKNRGITTFYEFDYDNKFGFKSLKATAKDLAEYIEKNIKEETLNIIGISQGGVIALAYLKFYPNKNVEKLFTLCTPHKGSRLAKIFNLPGLVDLQPSSALLKELESFAEKSKTNMYSVYTPFDLMVFPGWNARAKYGKQKLVFALTHPAAFSCRATKKFILKNLF